MTCCAIINLTTHHSACMRGKQWCALSSAPVTPVGVSRSCSAFPIRGGRKGHTVPTKRLPSADKVWSAVWKSSFLPPSSHCHASMMPLILSAVGPPLEPMRPASLTAAHAWKPAWVQRAVVISPCKNV
ncbi:hypothetical protein QQF64_034708 [Cirrhinus molitorella]|uniref:Uncharacterized protein n=1 Tax=Cirrhinus molitorella TaxID=172907 RepID=A0ABR3L217_9TELE